MKKILMAFLILAMVFSLAACGGGETSGSGEKPSGGIADIDGGGKEQASDGDAGTSSLSWPSADYITPSMKYTGSGEITDVEIPPSYKMEDQTICETTVYLIGSNREDVKAYIDALKADGFSWYDTSDGTVPEKLDDGNIIWRGEADSGSRFVTVTYLDDDEGEIGTTKYNLLIQMLNANLFNFLDE